MIATFASDITHCGPVGCGQVVKILNSMILFETVVAISEAKAIGKLLQIYPIDPKRIYATGISNGGMMSHRLGIELSDRFAAIAPVVGAVFGDERRPAREQGVFWAAADGCANVPDENDRGQYTHWQYRCPAGRAVELYLVKNNGHAWPGGQSGSRMGDTPSTSLNGTDVIWEIFKAHVK